MVLMRPFVPFSEDDSDQLLTAFMAARMDGEQLRRAGRVRDAARRAAPRPRHRRGQHPAPTRTCRSCARCWAAGVRGALRQPAARAHRQRPAVRPAVLRRGGRGRTCRSCNAVIVAYGDDVVIEETLPEALHVAVRPAGHPGAARRLPGAETEPATRRAGDTHRHGRRAGRALLDEADEHVRRGRRRPRRGRPRHLRGPRRTRPARRSRRPSTLPGARTTLHHDHDDRRHRPARRRTRRVGGREGPVRCRSHNDAGGAVW